MTAAVALPRPTSEIAPIVAVIGTEAALRLVERYGGLRIEIPVRVHEGSKLGRAIGLPALRLMVDAYGGARLNVPLCKPWRVRVLRVSRGMSYAEIAHTLNIAERSVHRILYEAGMTGQLSLPGL